MPDAAERVRENGLEEGAVRPKARGQGEPASDGAPRRAGQDYHRPIP